MPLLADLKAETADQHAALETGLDLFRRAATPEGYRDTLTRFYTLYQPLEERLGSAIDWEELSWDFDGRRKTPWLIRDLQVLGLERGEIEEMPLCHHLPAIESLGSAVGCLYVLEGSTLGGQFISRRLRQMLGISRDNGGQFFAGYGDETGPNWRHFCDWAEGLAARGTDGFTGAAVKSARATFECFSRWFQCPVLCQS